MIEKGEFLIGTLHNFQNIERFGSEIGDEGEGTFKTRNQDNLQRLLTPTNRVLL